MLSLPPITLRLRGWKLIDRVALAFLVLCAIALGAGCGLLFVYAATCRKSCAGTYRPDVRHRRFTPMRQLAGSFALQRRILMTYEQCPKVLYSAVTPSEDPAFRRTTGASTSRVWPAPLSAILSNAASLAGQHHHHAACRESFPGPAATAASAQNEEISSRCRSSAATPSHKSLRCTRTRFNLRAWQLRFPRRAQILFRQAGHRPESQEAALLAGMVNGPKFSPPHESGTRAWPPQSGDPSHGRRREDHTHGRSPRQEITARLAFSNPRNDLAPYFFEEIRSILITYGTEAVHERGLRVYTTLKINMQRIANQSLRDGLHSYETPPRLERAILPRPCATISASSKT